jgi:hypothetical protein
MSRLRQKHPNNYRTSPNISDEFESIIRYLNTAELGDKTVGELLDKIFDENGELDAPLELRFDATKGLQYRFGTFDGVEDGWETIASASDLKGAAGANVGTIEGPVLSQRQDYTASGGQTVFSYAFDDGDDVVVFKNGLLLAETAYVKSHGADTVTLVTPAVGGDKVTIYKIREGSVTNYRRSDQTSAASQAVFPFAHTEFETILVYRNGVLQREGASFDYTRSSVVGVVTFNTSLSAGELVTIFTIENTALQSVSGLMLEDEYTVDGFIPWQKLSVEDGDIAQAKVSGLIAALADGGKVFVQASAPATPVSGWIWIDTSVNPNLMKFWNGADWLSTSNATDIPVFGSAQAGKFLKANGTGTALEFGDYDDTHLVPKTYMGAASGVATLDADGKLPTTQLPEIFALDTLYNKNTGAVANGNYQFKRIFKQKIRIDAISLKTTSGTCSVNVTVDGVDVGSVYAAGAALSETNLGAPIEVDATSGSKLIGYKVASGASPVDLEVALAIAGVSV